MLQKRNLELLYQLLNLPIKCLLDHGFLKNRSTSINLVCWSLKFQKRQLSNIITIINYNIFWRLYYEDTFVFYFGDHGGVLPRSKGYAYESGLHVPLVVRVPKNFKYLVKCEPGHREKGFVEFVDFGPTILNLSGAEIPGGIDGKPFLGEGAGTRNYTFNYADRFDEKYDFVRWIRKGKYSYQRNFQPFNFDALQNDYRYRQLAFEEWRQLYKKGKLNAIQRQFFETRPVEALYDIEADPH